MVFNALNVLYKRILNWDMTQPIEIRFRQIWISHLTSAKFKRTYGFTAPTTCKQCQQTKA